MIFYLFFLIKLKYNPLITVYASSVSTGPQVRYIITKHFREIMRETQNKKFQAFFFYRKNLTCLKPLPFQYTVD